MPVMHESSQPSVARATFEKVMRVTNLQPLIGAKGFSRFLVNKPDSDPHKYVWAHPDNVYRKKAMYGAETVTAEYAYKTLKMPKDTIKVPDNCCMKDGLILMRYLPDALAVREMFPLYSAMTSAGADMKAFNKSEGAVVIDPATNRPIRERDERRDQAASHYKRNPTPSMSDITSEQAQGIASALARAEKFAQSAELDQSIPRDADGLRMVTTGE